MSDDQNPAGEAAANRRYRRIAVRTNVRISTIDPETDPTTGRPYFRTSEETCANVSRGGAYVETEVTVSPGRRVLLKIDLPEGEHLQAVGRVAWTKTALQPTGRNEGPGMGIEFVGASPEDLGRLECFPDEVNRPANDAPASPTTEGAPKTTQAAEDPSPGTLPTAAAPPRS